MEQQLPIRVYFLTFAALMGLLALTAFAPFSRPRVLFTLALSDDLMRGAAGIAGE